jgi:tryptophanyl-tRNA synthetase
VPVGRDQVQHLEMARDIAQRFNHQFGRGRELFVLPEVVIDEELATLPGLDGRKMSKSYDNSIFISDPEEEIRAKVMSFMTDPARKLKTDPGDPDICPLHQVHKLIADAGELAEWDRCCRVAECGCVAHKRKLADDLVCYLAPFQERRSELAAIPGFAAEVLAGGADKARPVTTSVVATWRELMGLDPRTALSAGIVARDAGERVESAPSFIGEE